jgi:signal transduction histidine kinase
VTGREQTGIDDTWPAFERRKPGWATDWQSSVELDKAMLAKRLHDNTGGLLVAAVMDVTWAERRLSEDSTAIRARLDRARATLDVVIELNRRMIEELRPTLLDNFGLVAALKWHLAETCKAADIVCEQQLPETTASFSPPAAIALFRIVQTLVAVMISHEAHSVLLRLSLDAQYVTLDMRCEGASKDFSRTGYTMLNALASVTARVNALGGDMQFEAPPRGVGITCRLPAGNALIFSP